MNCAICGIYVRGTLHTPLLVPIRNVPTPADPTRPPYQMVGVCGEPCARVLRACERMRSDWWLREGFAEPRAG